MASVVSISITYRFSNPKVCQTSVQTLILSDNKPLVSTSSSRMLAHWLAVKALDPRCIAPTTSKIVFVQNPLKVFFICRSARSDQSVSWWLPHHHVGLVLDSLYHLYYKYHTTCHFYTPNPEWKKQDTDHVTIVASYARVNNDLSCQLMCATHGCGKCYTLTKIKTAEEEYCWSSKFLNPVCFFTWPRVAVTCRQSSWKPCLFTSVRNYTTTHISRGQRERER